MKNNSEKFSYIMKKHYETSELKKWADDVINKGLIPEEYKLIEKYSLNKKTAILEVGCGGGRISLALAKKGYQRITGIDFSNKMINYAKKNMKKMKIVYPIDFQVADAMDIPYENESFDIILYFANLLCFLVNRDDRLRAMHEGYRVLKKGGFALISVLNYNARAINPPLKIIVNIIRLFRNPMGYNSRLLPWLKNNNKINWKFLFPSQAQAYWYLPEELAQDCIETGFKIEELTSSFNLNECYKSKRLSKNKGGIYLVAKRHNSL